MAAHSFVVEPDRQDAITRGTLSNDDFDGEMDDASYHIESIEEKGLPIDPINAYNHMATSLYSFRKSSPIRSCSMHQRR